MTGQSSSGSRAPVAGPRTPPRPPLGMRGGGGVELPEAVPCQPAGCQPSSLPVSLPSQGLASTMGVGSEHGEEARSDLARHESELSRMEAEQQVGLPSY